MAKKLLQYYTFDASAQSITIDGIYGLDRFLMITNVTDNIIMYIFSNSDFNFSSYSIDTAAETTTVVLDYDTTSMSDSDELQIFVEMEGQEFKPAEPYLDAVSKMRVTNPQNLIDTDFEYGLQSTKWETLELVKNIPTFFSRNGDQSLDLTTVTRTNGSEIIDVVTDQIHGLAAGNPIIVQGTDSNSANGAFVVTKIISTTAFQYKAKSTQSATGSILDTYTQIFVGSVYQGTEFQLSNIDSITTNAANPSTLTVKTDSPTGFAVGTSFFLSNSVGSKAISFNAASGIDVVDGGYKVESHATSELTDDADASGWAMTQVMPYKWTPKKAKYYVAGTDPDATITVDASAETMTFTDSGHGFSDGDCVMHYLGTGNTLPGGLSERWYYITVVDANTIKFHTSQAAHAAGTPVVNLTNAGANGGYARGAFCEAIKPSSVNTSTETITFEQNVPYTDTPYVVGYTTVSSLAANVAYNTADLDDVYHDDGSGDAVYALTSGSTSAQFSNTDGGSVRNLTATGTGGCLVPMLPWAAAEGTDRFSIYLPDGGWEAGDLVEFYSSYTATTAGYLSGLSNNAIYELEAAGTAFPNRWRFKNSGISSVSTAVVEFRSFGLAGNSSYHIRVTEVGALLHAQDTGETSGFNHSPYDPYSFNFDEAFYFKPLVSEVTVAGGQWTFATTHGLTNGKPYVYFDGYGNGTATGLTDSRWYYIKVIDVNTIEFHTNSTLTAKVNVTSIGTHGGTSRAALVRAYVADSIDISAEEMTFTEALGNATSGGSQAYIAAYTTMGGLSFLSNSNNLVTTANESYIVYAKKVTNSGQTIVFSETINGSNKNLNSTTINGAVMRVTLNPVKNTLRIANHKFTSGDEGILVSNSPPTGLSSGSLYTITNVVGDRFGFILYTSGTEAAQNITTQGGTSSTHYSFVLPRSSFNSGANTITSTSHGLNNGDLVVYDNDGGTTIKGLTDGNTYYVSNSSTNAFQLAETINGFDGDALNITHNATQITSDVNIFSGTGTSNAHGLTSGDLVQYISDTPLLGLQSGGFYYVKAQTAYAMRLYMDKQSAIHGTTDALIYFGRSRKTGTATIRKVSTVDLKRAGTGTQTLTASTVGSSDGVYTIDALSDSDNTVFTMAAPSQINDRVVGFNSDNAVWIEQDAIYLPDHFFVDLQPVTYSAETTVVTGLTDATEYYIIRQSRNWIRLAASADDAAAGTYITLTGKGSGAHTLTADSVAGQIIGEGTISINSGSAVVTGTDTNFTSFFNTGDSLTLYQEADITDLAVSSINTSTDVITTATHGLTTEDMVVMDAADAPGGTENGYIYYVAVISSTTFTIHPTAADATAGTNTVDLSTIGSGVSFQIYNDLGAAYTRVIKTVTGPGNLELTTDADFSLDTQNYAIGTSLLIRADGFAIHRPYDGGVDLVPSKNPDSTMIRQTRRYFRYQSGKSIQVSFAINFSPSTQIEKMVYDSGTDLATITTRYPHRLDDSLSVVVSNATTTSPSNFWNGTHAIDSIVDDFNFKVTLSGGDPTTDAVTGAGGLPEFYVSSWSNSALRCGLFDDQNGLFFEFDGSTLYCCRRSSITQLSGTSAVTFRSGQITGTNTRFTSQVTVGDKLVIKGQTHVVTSIASDTSLFVMPSYRGVDNSNVIITKTEVTRVPQSSWNLDPCDGTGPTGFFLRTHRIQMAYIDYSWYGAGKVRFGFKDQRGQVVYVHEFIHNNQKNEAYMRSGNLPARYEIENIGAPTYVPALAHWGTSVIMDGKFDPDNAYLFTASSNNIQLTGSNSVTVSARAETTSNYYYFYNSRWYSLGRALLIETPSFLYNSVPGNVSITGTDVNASTLTRVPSTFFGLPNQPYQVSLRTRYGSSGASATEEIRNLMLINSTPTGTSGAVSNYTATISTTGAPVVYDVPLISIRLAPSVDTNTPGFLGEREIINRMQLILNSVGILTTHNCKITLRLNGLITNTSWERVQNPSLSQLIYHTNQDTILGGIDIFEFRAQGGTGTSDRSAVVTDQDLGDIVTLGNSILGGDNVFPDGPDVLTVVAQLSEDPSTVSTSNPFNATGRLSWSESQA